MIRYAVPRAAVEAEIQRRVPTWAARAAQRTADLLRLGRYEEDSSIWSEVKPVFMALQHNKCVFCERRFEDEAVGTIEHDLEHFRPKGATRPWTVPSSLAGKVPAGGGPDLPGGYYWLAYDVGNYAAACKPCNSVLKADRFPIAGARGAVGTTPSDLLSERPYLCYPLGALDADPERLVTFRGPIAVPASRSGHANLRGQVIIEFFGLNRREQLVRQRCEHITHLMNCLRIEADGSKPDAERRRYGSIAAVLGSEKSPHAACARAFRKLWADDRAQAERVGDACAEWYAGGFVSPRPPF